MGIETLPLEQSDRTWEEEHSNFNGPLKTYECGPSAGDDAVEHVRSVVEETAMERGIVLDKPVTVEAREWMLVQRSLKADQLVYGAINTAERLGESDSHMLIVDYEAFCMMDEDARRGVIAHELCHAYAEEEYGDASEGSEDFKLALERFDAPKALSSMGVGKEDFEDHSKFEEAYGRC